MQQERQKAAARETSWSSEGVQKATERFELRGGKAG